MVLEKGVLLVFFFFGKTAVVCPGKRPTGSLTKREKHFSRFLWCGAKKFVGGGGVGGEGETPLEFCLFLSLSFLLLLLKGNHIKLHLSKMFMDR